MPLSLLSPSADGARLEPVDSRRAPLFTFALLTVACALASFALACATPFAAFAVIAAAILPLRPALLVATGAWLVNQGIGFGALHYPVDGDTMQDARTNDLLFGPAELVSYISTFTTLRPGDLILTGTPAGVGDARDPKRFIAAGELVVVALEGVSECRNRFVAPTTA